MYVLLITIDLSLAFDCIETSNILPEKLKYYGANKQTTDFFRNFFTGRRHQTEWQGALSDILNLNNISCVQGSCLGPPVFNLYTRDLQKVCKDTIISFADDTNLIIASKKIENLTKNANKVLKKIAEYMAANQLLINIGKTQALLFKPKNQPKENLTGDIEINGKKIELTNTAKYLGIILDNQLKFDHQFNSLEKKLTKATNALLATRKLLSKKAKYMIYNALFKSNLEYGAISYFDKLNKTQLESLTTLQKQSVRLIFNAKPRVHTKKLYEITKILPVKQTHKIESVKCIYKITNELTRNKQPKAISELLTKKIANTRTTRLSQNPNKLPLNSTQPGSLFYKIIQTWNEADETLKNAGNYRNLSKMLKVNAVAELESCETQDCYVCNMDKHILYTEI